MHHIHATHSILEELHGSVCISSFSFSLSLDGQEEHLLYLSLDC